MLDKLLKERSFRGFFQAQNQGQSSINFSSDLRAQDNDLQPFEPDAVAMEASFLRVGWESISTLAYGDLGGNSNPDSVERDEELRDERELETGRALLLFSCVRLNQRRRHLFPKPSRDLFFLEDTPLLPRVYHDERFRRLASRLVKRLGASSNDVGGVISDRYGLKPPFSCAIYGPWGCGKTSFLRAIEHAYNVGEKSDVKGGDPSLPKAITVFFEPWRYEEERHLIIPLLSEVSSAICAYQARAWGDELHDARIATIETTKKLLGTLARDILRKASKIADQHIGVDFLALGEKFVAEYTSLRSGPTFQASEATLFKSRLRELLISTVKKEENKFASGKIVPVPPVVVFVDDLDRCGQEQTRRLLESMKLFLSENGMHYFLALDEEQVLRALSGAFHGIGGIASSDEHAKTTARRYLEKFFQHSIDLGGATSPLHEYVPELKDRLWSELSWCFEGGYRVRSKKVERSVDGGEVSFEEILESLERTSVFKPWVQNLVLRAACCELFWCIKPNPRVLKAAARWLYFNMPDTLDKDSLEERSANGVIKKIVSDFAEFVLSINFGDLWVRELGVISSEDRQACYKEILDVFESIGLAPILLATLSSDEGKKSFDHVPRSVQSDVFAGRSYEDALEDSTRLLRRIVSIAQAAPSQDLSRNGASSAEAPASNQGARPSDAGNLEAANPDELETQFDDEEAADALLWINVARLERFSHLTGLLDQLAKLSREGTALRNLYVAMKYARAANEMIV